MFVVYKTKKTSFLRDFVVEKTYRTSCTLIVSQIVQFQYLCTKGSIFLITTMCRPFFHTFTSSQASNHHHPIQFHSHTPTWPCYANRVRDVCVCVSLPHHISLRVLLHFPLLKLRIIIIVYNSTLTPPRGLGIV